VYSEEKKKTRVRRGAHGAPEKTIGEKDQKRTGGIWQDGRKGKGGAGIADYVKERGCKENA